jgi:hypothetical protein
MIQTLIQNDCVCDIPNGGYCQRHNVYKVRNWVWNCVNNPEYFARWENGTGPGQRDNAVTQAFEGVERVKKEKKSKPEPGTELKKIIAAWQRWLPWFDLSEHKGCSCHETAVYMNRLGPDRCIEHMDIILNKLEAEAKRRKLSIPFQRFWAERMVRQAVLRSRKK